MKFEIFHASELDEAAQWQTTLEVFPFAQQDIHFTPAYGRVQEKLGGKSILACLSDDSGYIIQPFIMREVPGMSDCYDLCSPYGYGGPLRSPDCQISSNCWQQHLTDWAKDIDVVCEFCYLHPMLPITIADCIGESGQVSRVKDVVIIDLANLSLSSVSRRIRRGLKKADEYTPYKVPDNKACRQAFYSLYNSSMNRKNASKRWRFGNGYLDAHYNDLGASVFVMSTWRRALMVIGQQYNIEYAHLLASDGQWLNEGLDETLYFWCAIFARERGARYFHLGGGLTKQPDDKLLAFKRGFDGTVRSLYSYTRIFDDDLYDQACKEKISQEVAEHGHPLPSGFFPLYRREA